MAERRYYSQRTGKPRSTAALELNDLKRIFLSYFEQLEGQGYFHEALGYECVDTGFCAGTLGTDLQAELQLTLHRTNLWPIKDKIGFWDEDDLFDMIEFLFDHVAKPTSRWYHEYNSCGWHCTKFDRASGQLEYRKKLRRLLQAYDSGFELSDTGEVVAVAQAGFEPLVAAPVPSAEPDKVQARVDAAIAKFRRHRSSIEDRKDAVRDLADVLEYLKDKVAGVLDNKDERDLFNIANNFSIRHHNDKQKSNYDKPIWLSWMFYFYLATIHASLRLIEKREPGKMKAR
jgi:hypothetical protein